MSIDDKWADRVFRAPKTGSDYTSARGHTQKREVVEDTLRTTARKAIDQDLLEQQKSEIADMQLVINRVVRRIDQLEDNPVDEDTIYMQRRIRRLEIFVIVLSSALLLAVIMKILNVMGINVFSLLTGF